MQTSFAIQVRNLNTKQKLQVDFQEHCFWNLQSCVYIYVCEDCSFPLKQVMCLESEVVYFLVMLAKRNYHFIVWQYNNNNKCIK